LKGSRLIPAAEILDSEVAELAARAGSFLRTQSWCQSVVSTKLAWGVAGVLAVFLVRIQPRDPTIDETLWVVVGDIPSAYLVQDDNPTWREALTAYVREMNRWVGAVRMHRSLDDVIPVKVAPTRENADALAVRLAFIQSEILAVDAAEVQSDT
jgi:hypothetical protein